MSRYRKTMSEAISQVYEAYDKDHEVSMARTDLQSIADKALIIDKHLKDHHTEETGIDGWIASKITKAADYINAVHDHMIYSPEMNEGYTADVVKKAKDIAKKFAGNMTKAYDEIEKLAKNLSKNTEVQQALRQYNEESDRPKPSDPNPKEIEEGIMKDIYTMDKEGSSVEDIAKRLKINVDTVKKILGEAVSVKQSEEPMEPVKADPEKEKEDKEKEVQTLKNQVALLKQKIENEKNKAIKPEPNPKTGEVPLTVGIAYKVFKDQEEKEKEVKEETLDEKVADSIIKDLQKAYGDLKGKTISPEMANKISKHLDQPSYDLDTLRQLVKANIPFISTLAKNKVYRKTGKFEDRRIYVESIAGLQKKADQSGMPYSILKQVYDRGMAAWKSGHRPGASQQQWAFARVNSFVTKSSGTWGGADKDLAAKIKGSK